MSFDLSEAIDAQVARTRKPNPARIATKVANAVPEHELRPLLAKLLRQAVTHRMSRDRNYPARVLTGEGQGDADTHATSAPRSARWERVRDWRTQPVCIIGDDGETWKQVRDCTRDDIARLVATNERLAATHRENAERWRRVLALMVEHGAETVGDLPDEIGAAA